MTENSDSRVYKCPGCGSNIDSFVSRCPYCDREIRNEKKSKSIDDFTKGLNDIYLEKLPQYKSEDSLMKKIVGTNFKEDEKRTEFEYKVKEEKEERIASYISNYSIPNYKEDIKDFMILTSSSINLKKNSDVVREAWIKKMDETYQKAKLILKGEDLDEVKIIYEKKKEEIRTKTLNTVLGGIFLISLFFFFLLLIQNVFFGLSELFLSSAILLFILFKINNNKIPKTIKGVIKYACLAIAIIGIVLGLIGIFNKPVPTKTEIAEQDYYDAETKKYDVTIDIKFNENLFFSKYNVVLKIYDNEDTLYHGKEKTLHYSLPIGEHKLEFSGEGNKETVILKVKGETYVKYEITSKSGEIVVTEVDYSSDKTTKKEENKEETTNSAETTTTETSTTTTTVETTTTTTKKAVYYSSNDSETVKNGNSGIYAYRSDGNYYVYYLIDFDKKEVYYFTEGNGDESLIKAPIISGDLNDKIITSWTDGDDTWKAGLHFKWKRQPDILIVQHENGIEFEFYITNLKEAQEIMKKKKSE